MPVLQWSERHVVDRPANMHQNALIFVVPAVALLTPWMQNSFKIVENHRWQHVICRRSCPPRGGPIRSVSKSKKVYEFGDGPPGFRGVEDKPGGLVSSY